MAVPPDLPATASPQLRIGQRAPRLLVVDDEGAILEMLRLRLQSMGGRVVTVSGGAGAVAAARTHRPDLILLDVMMPDVDGFSVIRQLKQDPALADVPVIFMTARDELDSRVQGLDLGAHDYVTKPFNTVELLARIRAALRVKALQDELHEKNKQLEDLASNDPLTNLPNRRTFDEQVFLAMERARRNSQVLSCLIFDIDGFKGVNDTFGHQTGDEVLRQIGQLLLNRRRAVDVVARYGGEEFVWLLPGADRPAAVQLGEWLLRAVREIAVETPQGPVGVSVSIGVSTYDPAQHGEVPTDRLLQDADAGLLEAKQQGKGRVVFRELSPPGAGEEEAETADSPYQRL